MANYARSVLQRAKGRIDTHILKHKVSIIEGCSNHPDIMSAMKAEYLSAIAFIRNVDRELVA